MMQNMIQNTFRASFRMGSKTRNVNFTVARSFSAACPPHGGDLVNLMVTDPAEKKALAAGVDSVIELNERQSCDVELIINGGFSPINGFMNESTYDTVVDKMRLPNDLLFGLPVVLDTARSDVKKGEKILLTFEGDEIAVLEVEDSYTPDKVKETFECYGTTSLEHPGVRMVSMEREANYLGGKLTGLNLPKRVFPCATPQQVRDMLPSKEGKDVVAFQCRNPVHRAHYELFTRALDADNVDKEGGGVVLVHPTCGPTQEDDISGVVRHKTYEVLKAEMNDDKVFWAYLPYSMHMAGPREAIQHMMIRKNYGCTHFIIGRDMAGSKSSRTGEDYYGPYDAQDMANKYSSELGVKTVPSLNLVYTAEEGYITADKAQEMGIKPVKLSGTEFRRKLRAGEDIPEWFAFKSVVQVLRESVKAGN